ncbi:conserved membrane hypothetical protein [Planktothrix serta PCC 8927]|uniref:DUF2029 domain-containing protein n=1 Tax=Planktothrix serta PCC 8927 TaxID=671068 RepID=A0A7Z9BMK1_9CYAN|nr:hypothetical protein [Planktothrix serta]VXD17895.1 conserved membrane hypothetical protein [Planktothrix serta PCC 8927]
MKISSQQKWLIYPAAFLALILAFELIRVGYDSDSPAFLDGYIRRGVEYTLLNGIYILWLVKGIRSHPSSDQTAEADRYSLQDFSTLIKPGAIFLIAAWMSYPATTDPYLYLHYGMVALSSYNPYLVPAGDFTSQFSSLSPWSQTATYGPISLAFFMIAAATSSISIGVGIYSLKTLFLLIHLLNSYLIWNQVKTFERGNFITIAYLINPIILFEQVGNARVDVLLCTALILLVKFLIEGRYVRSVAAIWLGILSKTLPIIWAPLLGVFLLKLRRWKSIAFSLFLSIMLLFILSQTLLTEAHAWISLLNPGVAWHNAGSFHDILNRLLTLAKPFLPALIVQKQAGLVWLFKICTYILYCLYYAWICLRTFFRRHYTAFELILDLGWVTLTLFLFATPWYQPWYATVLICFVALLNFRSPFFCFVALTYSVCSTVVYYLFAGGSEFIPLLFASIMTVVPTTLLLLLKSKITQGM